MNSYLIPNIILPTYAPLGTEVEAIADAAQHVSLAFGVHAQQEKTVQVYATNLLGLAAPLWVWVEVAPSNVNAAYVQLAAPTILVVTGNTILQWTTHSSWARVVAQCPAWVLGAWAVQIIIEGKGP